MLSALLDQGCNITQNTLTKALWDTSLLMSKAFLPVSLGITDSVLPITYTLTRNTV